MRKKFKNMIIIFIIVMMLINAFATMSFAESTDEKEVEIDFTREFNSIKDLGFAVLDGVVGIITWVVRAPLAIVLTIVDWLLARLFGNGAGAILSPEDIIFSGAQGREYSLLNVNFFNFSTSNSGLVLGFRENVAKWYYVLRSLSIVFSLAILIYIGIRMAISSVAEDKAKYKQMLINWIVGFCVLFLLHYLIIIIIFLNNQMVSLIYNAIGNQSNQIKFLGGGITTNNAFEAIDNCLQNALFSTSFVQGFASLILYFFLMGMTIKLLYMYLKRLFTVGFLIVISPLITVTYSIDKIGDGKSQALSTWLKEFAYNVLIQPFHCIIYVVFVSSAISAISNDGELISSFIFAMIGVLFIDKAEDIVRNIFGFSKAHSLEGAVAAGALVASTLSKANGLRKGKDGTSQKTSNTVHRKQVPNGTTSTGNGGTSTGNGSTPTGNGGTPTGNGGTSTGNGSTSTGNGSTSNSQTGSALGRAMSDYKNKIGDKLREIKSDPVGKLSNTAKNIPIRALAASTNVLPKVLLGATVTGWSGNVITGFAAGSAYKGTKFTRNIGNAAKEDLVENKQYTQDKILASAYESYKMANSDMSDEELYNKSIDLLKANPDRLTDKNEIALAKALQATQDNYINAGYEDYKVKTMNKLEDIQNGAVKSSIDIRAGKVIEAAKQYRNSTPGMSNNDVIVESKEIMESIDNYNGSNYLKSDEYNNLGDEKKKLAKEIHKSKKLISSIGEHSNDEINREIERRINNDLI